MIKIFNEIDESLKILSNDELIAEIQKLRNAIRNHKEQKEHDRCWLDDLELYKILPESISEAEQRLQEKKEFIDNYYKYYEHRQNPSIVFIRQNQTDLERVLNSGFNIDKFGLVCAVAFEDGSFGIHEYEYSEETCRIEFASELLFTSAKETIEHFLKRLKEREL